MQGWVSDPWVCALLRQTLQAASGGISRDLFAEPMAPWGSRHCAPIEEAGMWLRSLLVARSLCEK